MRFQHIEYDDPANRDIVRRYGINGVPYVVILNAEGTVVRRRGGALRPEVYQADIETALRIAP